MDLNSKHASPVLTDPVSINKSRLGIQSSLLPYSLPTGVYSSILPYTPPEASFSANLYLASMKKSLSGKFDVINWLDSMKCSSPRKNLNNGSASDGSAKENEIVYYSWLLKYPSALISFDKIASSAQGKQIALFLDYDGTLSPIVNDPDNAIMSQAMRIVVSDVADYCPTAIISGRCRDKVFEFVGLPKLYYAGSHGMDIIGPAMNSTIVIDCPNHAGSNEKQDKEVKLFQPASGFIPMINEVFRSLVEGTKEIKGAKVENNKFCVSVHYRLVDENNWSSVAKCVHDIIKEYPKLRLTHGRKVLEVRPIIEWDKGKAVEFLLESLGLNDSNVLPIYIGDDRTDEDAFKALRELKRGYGILVSSVPKESNAFYSLKDPTEVMDFLKSLVIWKKTCGLQGP